LEYNAITIHLADKQKQSVIFEIQLGVSVLVDGYPKDSQIGIKSMALVDTGSTGSCISRNFAENAQLKSFKIIKVLGAHGFAFVPVYLVDVLLPNGILFSNMEVAEFYGGNNFDFIIGMNILRKGDMALTNANGEMVFSFRIPPAETHIDFAKEMKNT
jgi:predicted aspartyl protease